MVVQVVIHKPLPSDLAHNKPAGARFWTELQPFFKVKVFAIIRSIPSPLERGPPNAAYPKYSQGAGVPHLPENAPPYDPAVGLRLWLYGGLGGVGRFRMRGVPL